MEGIVPCATSLFLAGMVLRRSSHVCLQSRPRRHDRRGSGCLPATSTPSCGGGMIRVRCEILEGEAAVRAAFEGRDVCLACAGFACVGGAV